MPFTSDSAARTEQHCETVEQIRLARVELRRMDQVLALAAQAAQQAYGTQTRTA